MDDRDSDFDDFLPQPISRNSRSTTTWECYYNSEEYKCEMTAKLHTTIYCELMMRVCTPARLYQWNEGAADQFPEEYLRKCAEYK
jgi:hypothetical protein